MTECDILFVIRSMGLGGAERQLSVLARRLHAAGFRVAVAVFYAEGVLLREIIDAGIPLIDLRKKGRWSNAGVARRLAGFVSAHRPRVVHSYMPAENIMALLLKPWITRHGGAVVCGVRTANLQARKHGVVVYMIYMIQRILLPFADRVICNSGDALRELRRWIRPNRGFAIPNGIEVERFLRNTAKRDALRRDWGMADGILVIGIVGRLDPLKNHQLAITALKPVITENPDVKIVMIGGGSASYKRTLHDHAAAMGLADHILWTGPLGDMSAVYSALDILCLPSAVEGFPNVVAEAMCAGLPCVATDVGDTALVIGDTGWTVPPNDAAALSAAIGGAIAALRDWDFERPKNRVAENFSAAKLAERTLAVLAPFLERNPA